MSATHTDPDPAEVLRGVGTIAVVGASADPDKDANRIPTLVADAGFHVVPVNPSGKEILGRTAATSLDKVDEPIDMVDVFRPAEETPGIAREAVRAGARVLWLQLGITSAEARQIAADAGLVYLEDVCMGATLRQAGISRL
jgi:predicted CoA-binding protein